MRKESLFRIVFWTCLMMPSLSTSKAKDASRKDSSNHFKHAKHYRKHIEKQAKLIMADEVRDEREVPKKVTEPVGTY